MTKEKTYYRVEIILLLAILFCLAVTIFLEATKDRSDKCTPPQEQLIQEQKSIPKSIPKIDSPIEISTYEDYIPIHEWDFESNHYEEFSDGEFYCNGQLISFEVMLWLNEGFFNFNE